MYALRTNLNVAIGAMVKNHTVFIDGVETEKVSQFSLTFFKQLIHEMLLSIYEAVENFAQVIVLLCIVF